MNLNTYLRLRPLEQKHKLKEDYFTLKSHQSPLSIQTKQAHTKFDNKVEERKGS